MEVPVRKQLVRELASSVRASPQWRELPAWKVARDLRQTLKAQPKLQGLPRALKAYFVEELMLQTMLNVFYYREEREYGRKLRKPRGGWVNKKAS